MTYERKVEYNIIQIININIHVNININIQKVFMYRH